RLKMALRSREIWDEVLDAADLKSSGSGSIHLAYREDERAVIADFAELGPAHGYRCRWMKPDEVHSRCTAVRVSRLLGGLWSDTEMVVDPRAVVRVLPRFLAERYGVQLRYGCPVHSVELPAIRTATEEWQVERALVCSGDDLDTLFPDVLAAAGLV